MILLDHLRTLHQWHIVGEDSSRFPHKASVLSFQIAGLQLEAVVVDVEEEKMEVGEVPEEVVVVVATRKKGQIGMAGEALVVAQLVDLAGVAEEEEVCTRMSVCS